MLLYSSNGSEEADLPDEPLVIRTPVLGFVELEEREARLIRVPEFQRADRIKQLALTHYVYPGATHSRLLHTFTMVELGTQLLRRMRDKADATYGTAEDWQRRIQLFRLGALYHDLGHAPFSHASESLFPHIEVEGQLTGPQKTHEDYSAEIVMSENHAPLIDRLFVNEGITPDQPGRLDHRLDPGAMVGGADFQREELHTERDW